MSGEIIQLERQGDVFTLTMNAGENRWNTTLFGHLPLRWMK